MRWAAKVDTNHRQIVRVLEQLGCSVLELQRVGQGCPDIAIGLLGVTELAEIKFAKGNLEAHPCFCRTLHSSASL